MIAKTQEEITALRECGARLGTILKRLSAMVAPGVSTTELEAAARRLIEEGGDESAFLNYQPEGAPRPYPAALCVSINDVIQHGIPNENPRTVQDGDIVTLDLGLRHKGFVTDSAVSVIAGNPAPDDALLVRRTYEALEAGINAARVGNTIGDIGYAIESVARKYRMNFPKELGGHSVGRSVHEEPFVPNYGAPGTGPKITEGLVLAIEPMFMHGKPALKLERDGYTYRVKDGTKSAHTEHTVLITAAGPEILTQQ